MYSQYDNGDPIREIPEESKGKILAMARAGVTMIIDVWKLGIFGFISNIYGLPDVWII